MPNVCVVFGCSNTPNLYEGISLHAIPFANDDRPEAKRRRKAWVDFVKSTRAKWEPTSASVICSKHFKEEDFVRRFTGLHDKMKPMRPILKKDEFGVSACPCVTFPDMDIEKMSERGRRCVAHHAIFGESSTTIEQTVEERQEPPTASPELTRESKLPVEEEIIMDFGSGGKCGATSKEAWTQTTGTVCVNCSNLSGKLDSVHARIQYHRSYSHHGSGCSEMEEECNDDGESDADVSDSDSDASKEILEFTSDRRGTTNNTV